MSKLTREEIETQFQKLEQSVLQSSGAWMWMGIEISFVRCAKRNGGNIRKGKAWGKLTYKDIDTDQLKTQEEALDLVLHPSIRQAKKKLLHRTICAICGHKGSRDDENWGWLRYMEHEMHICLDCRRKIYEDSPKPWESN